MASATNGLAYKARSIREWAGDYMKHGTMGGYVQGQHIKTKSIISDENVQSKLREKLREMKDCDRTPGNFRTLLNNTLLQTFPSAPDSISERTANRCLAESAWVLYDDC
jgi:hypothetical protein